MKPSKKEISAEIESLEACKAYAPKMGAFGDDNHRNIELQIEELRDGIDDTAEEWDDYHGSEQEAINEAKAWKAGSLSQPPSAGWDSYKPAQAA